ncbi:Der GTPase-activating protein YihI [Alkalimonas collagenimarina]|uniref:Der GTPase-activating protein YihI n=1 Tax=Alkalimonas collagenimarina TaxID=400390 RepID=A0ABT9GZ75_9GAMM|nr:Der GTPase-activating protein YihI [Alkalimonas collagenimarina]MDP4535990.1 Der GTPase-activating protein YihI [Alkalimonas collagenimarina]
MTRQKKTRSAGDNGPRFLPASDVRKARERKEESKKSAVGGKAGQRNSPLLSKHARDDSRQQAAKDPRHGSKKPIPLLITEPSEQEQLQHSMQPKAQIGKVKAVALSPEQELAVLEQDEKLQQLLERVEQNEVLTGKDAKYFNRMTERYEQLLEILGLAEAPSDDPLAEFERKDWKRDLLGDDEEQQ